jgi:hypothetical protein
MRFFSSRQIVTILVTVCVTIVVMPTAVWAANTSLVRLTDGKGKVARIDSKGRLVVTDGSGPVTVDGKVGVAGTVAVAGKVGVAGTVAVGGTVSVGNTVAINGSVRTLAPASPWSYATDGYLKGQAVLLAGPTSSAISVTSLTASEASNETALNEIFLYGDSVPASTKTCPPQESSGAKVVWTIQSINQTTPVQTSFPTPLQYRAAAGQKACLYLSVFGGSYMVADVSGYTGN